MILLHVLRLLGLALASSLSLSIEAEARLFNTTDFSDPDEAPGNGGRREGRLERPRPQSEPEGGVERGAAHHQEGLPGDLGLILYLPVFSLKPKTFKA